MRTGASSRPLPAPNARSERTTRSVRPPPGSLAPAPASAQPAQSPRGWSRWLRHPHKASPTPRLAPIRRPPTPSLLHPLPTTTLSGHALLYQRADRLRSRSSTAGAMLSSARVGLGRAAARPQQAPRRAACVPLRPCRVVAQGQVFPGPQEEKEAAHSAFMHAFEASKPVLVRMPGLQQFAAAIWERRRRIPSTTYNDPLDHIFTEFDEDGDGHLTAEEIAHALISRGVEATADQVQQFIDAVDANKNGTVERSEFPDFIFHLAVADLKSVSSMEEK